MQFLETERLKSLHLDHVIAKQVKEKEEQFYEKHVQPLRDQNGKLQKENMQLIQANEDSRRAASKHRESSFEEVNMVKLL